MCPLLLNIFLDPPAEVLSEVTNVETDGSCSAVFTNMRILVGSTGPHPSCQVTVHLKDGRALVATVQFQLFEGSCCSLGSAIDASSLMYIDAGTAPP
jgi:hypothetical protein